MADDAEEHCVYRRYIRNRDFDRDGKDDIFVVFYVTPRAGDAKLVKYYAAFAGTRKDAQIDVIPIVDGRLLGADCVHFDGKEIGVRITDLVPSQDGQANRRLLVKFVVRKGRLVRTSPTLR